MDAAGVQTARWQAFTEKVAAVTYLAAKGPPYVIKANGLAAGKGVLVTEDAAEAEAWVERCLAGDFGEARIVVEDFLAGPELSVFAFCSGDQVAPFEPARDFKRLKDNDRGPNTGGMGAYSPVDDLPSHLVRDTVDDVIKPVLKTMSDLGRPYMGFLYAGLVVTEEGPKVLEFNCRLGDPETQVVLPRLQNDLIDLIEAGLGGRLESQDLAWSSRAFLNVVVAAPGYPEAPQLGGPVEIGELPEETIVFHAGTRRDGPRLVASGGRVLSVVGSGPTVEAARRNAYDGPDRAPSDWNATRKAVARLPQTVVLPRGRSSRSSDRRLRGRSRPPRPAD
jgi:phosphoribosylamine--glycine ligase